MSVQPARAHRIAAPRRARVQADPDDGRPLTIGDREVDAVRESWLVEDRWWNGSPVRRRYWEVVTTCGRDVVAFHDLRGGGWFVQR
jgi:CO dehydrogenase/acetyl-CoA synthase delta subunit